MLFRLFLLFTIVPALELSLLIYFGSVVGVLETVILVVFTAALGAYIVRLEGLGVVYRMQRDLAEGVFPADELFTGAMVLVAGALLLTPGFITDALGFLMVIPPTREAIKKALKRYIRKRMDSAHIHYL